MTIPPVFDPIVPQPESAVSETQKPLLVNFSDIYTAFLRNHITLDDPTNPGNHTNIQLKNQQERNISTQGQEIAIYSKKVDGQTDQVFMRYGANGKEFQITNYQIYPLQQTSTQKPFISFLPGAIMVYFGTVFLGNKKSGSIQLMPGCRNIIAVNLGGILLANRQPNVSLNAPINGIYTTVNLNSVDNIPDQFYLILGNI